MGPQLGYYDPEIVIEADLHGPGINAQGALTPGGSPYVLIGRTRDYAWSLTTATNDNTDAFLERLCGRTGGRARRPLRPPRQVRPDADVRRRHAAEREHRRPGRSRCATT